MGEKEEESPLDDVEWTFESCLTRSKVNQKKKKAGVLYSQVHLVFIPVFQVFLRFPTM